MYQINARNVAEALPLGLMYLLNHGTHEDSRAGQVLVTPGPVMTCYTHPRERVLVSPVRDANPFFHLAEIAWMLAGRDDAGFLNNFVADFGERFAESASGKDASEADGRIHGAYGKRWRREFDVDQLDAVVAGLTKNPESRQAVIQMWDCRPRRAREVYLDHAQHTFAYGCQDLTGEWRDRPCNTHAYLRVRRERGQTYAGHGNVYEYDDSYLDITVCCRSNDIIWGAYGANAVHFSALQEYLAARIGVEVGRYYQLSNNFHAYTEEIKRLTARASRWGFQDVVSGVAGYTYKADPMSMVVYPDYFDDEIKVVIAAYENHKLELDNTLQNRWVEKTLHVALSAHYLWKHAQKHTARRLADTIECPDWRKACTEWMDRRNKK